MGSACADSTRYGAYFPPPIRLHVAVFAPIWGFQAPQARRMGHSGGRCPRTRTPCTSGAPHLGHAGDGAGGAGAAILARRDGGQTTRRRAAGRPRATQRPADAGGPLAAVPARGHAGPAAAAGAAGGHGVRAESPRNSPPRVTRRKPASSIAPWPGTWSSPVAGSAASTRPAGSSARCRARARASRSSTTSTSCSTRRSCPRRRPACWSRVTSSRRCATCSTRRICAWESWSARDAGAAHGHAAGPGGLRARAALRPPRRRPRLGFAGAADPRAGRPCDRVQEPRRRDLAAQPRDPVHGGGGHVRRPGDPRRSC